MLRGETAPFHIEAGRWKGIPQEERLCRECERNKEVEDCSHWLLRCLRWEFERWHLLTRVEERFPNFAALPDDIQSTAITDVACKDRGIVQLIYSMWTRFSLTVSLHYLYGVHVYF